MITSLPAPREGAGATHRGVSWLPVLLAGGALGLFAFVGDELPGVVGGIVLTLTSTGFAWGAAALLAGYAATRGAVALITAAAVLLVATLAYYGLTLAVGQRWRSGFLEDGSSAAAMGLASVGRATAFWLAASVAAGVALGYLGSTIRLGTPMRASTAAGVALGLLAGQGLSFLISFRAWSILDEFYLGRVLSAGVSVLLTTAGMAAVFSHRKAAKSWLVFAATSVAACALGVLLWSQVETIRSAL